MRINAARSRMKGRMHREIADTESRVIVPLHEGLD